MNSWTERHVRHKYFSFSLPEQTQHTSVVHAKVRMWLFQQTLKHSFLKSNTVILQGGKYQNTSTFLPIIELAGRGTLVGSRFWRQ